MNVDRRLFLALTTAIATASTVACSASDPATGSDSQDVVQEGGGSVVEGAAPTCIEAQGEVAYSYQEGTCFDVAVRAYYRCANPTAEGGGWDDACDSYAWNFVYEKCHGYAKLLKKTFADEAVSCMTEGGDPYDCGFLALDRSCVWHPAAEGSCATIERNLAARGEEFTTEERAQCMLHLSGIRSAGRRQIENESKDGDWYGIHSAIEGLFAKP